MQKSVIVLISSLLSIFSLTSTAQTFSVCENSEITFEMEEDYWGEPVFEYSLDSLNWEELDINLNEPFIASEGTSGYYRLRMVDLECDTSYVSMTKFLNVSASPLSDITINSAFTDLEFPIGTDPYFWIYSQDTTLSDVIFHVNDDELLSESYSLLITNVDSSFTIYASALHPATGCTVYSDTAHYEVFDPNATTNAFFDVSGNFSLDNVAVVSQSDSIALQGDPNFAIDFSTAVELDFLYGIRTDNPADSSLLSISIIDPETTQLNIDNEGTAISLVLLHPSIIYSIWTEFTTLSESIPTHESFDDLVEIINQQLQTQGFLNLDDEVLNDYIVLIATSISEGDGFGFHRGGGLRDNTFPSIEPTSEGNLAYDSDGIDAFFTAIFYDSYNDSESNIIVMRPPNSMFQTALAQSLVNILLSNPDISDALQVPMRTTNLLYPFDVASEEGYKNIRLRLSTGNIFSEVSSETLAYRLNVAYNFIKIIMKVPQLVSPFLTGGITVANSLFDLFTSNIEQIFFGEEINFDDTYTAIAGVFAALSESAFAALVSAALVAYAAYQLTSDMVAWGESESTLHKISKIGNRLEHRLYVEHNADSTFKSLPGDDTYPIPYYNLKTKKEVFEANVYFNTWENGPLLYEGNSSELENFSNITLSTGLFNNTHEVEMDTGVLFDEPIVDHPVASGENFMNWMCSWDAAGQEAELGIRFEYDNYHIQDIDGLNPPGYVVWNCQVETPVMQVPEGQSQSGELGEQLLELIKTRVLSPTGLPVPDGYVVEYEVESGGGSVSVSSAETYTDGSTTGLTTTEWTLGSDEDEPQELRASLISPNTEEEIVGVTIYANSEAPCDLTNIYTDTRD